MRKAFIFLLLLGLLFTGIGVAFVANETMKIKLCSETTQGTIIDFDQRLSSNGSSSRRSRNRRYVYSPVVQYAVKGSVFTVTSNVYVGETLLKFEVGDCVSVRFNPKEPEMMLIQGYADHPLSGQVVFGGVFIYVGSLIGVMSLIGIFSIKGMAKYILYLYGAVLAIVIVIYIIVFPTRLIGPAIALASWAAFWWLKIKLGGKASDTK